MTRVTQLHHVSLLVDDTSRALEFYCGLLGLQSVARPDLGYAGAWLAIGDRQIHLIELESPDPRTGRPAHGGRDRHVAMIVDDLDGIRCLLDGAGLPYTLSRSGRQALFCRDPDGNGCELIAGA